MSQLSSDLVPFVPRHYEPIAVNCFETGQRQPAAASAGRRDRGAHVGYSAASRMP